MHCNDCNTDENKIETDWLNQAEENVTTYYCAKCEKFLGVRW